MVIENIMYFALGLLVAGLVSLIILPAVWKRAVRLTKRRIEAATPITMAEFRADKDQLRAEFALSTRRLEMNVETLRKRLAEQLGDVNQKRSDLGALKAERDQHLSIVKELEEREAELRARTTELERESTDLAQRLRMRDRELDSRNDEDASRLTAALAVEQKRATFLEDQARSLIARLESSDRRSAEATAIIGQLRNALANQSDDRAATADDLTAAEARIASAESRLNALLAETTETVEKASSRNEQLLADKLGLEAEVEQLRKKVAGVESSILEDWDTERLEEAHLRERLNDIAASVSRLVYAVDTENPPARPEEESLFDRVQRFADDGVSSDVLPVKPAKGERKGGSVSDRMAALREIQGR
ncbi:hypothetical protein SAMN05428969_2073 [Devosia sp. YR412]|uniref:hypothetical protein n=1 Tax=Devosia sp. YR412 TaxID=1881030 RepID=UPI0008BE7ABF|nr:hypothetical protein [Devosia sp. YR412]SEQ12209.1 hypothetical protein SAMN05428969_2073 [Devosia sp. YR412]